jgi:RNA polymerase sigma-70 factor (ECF subfamily)
VPEVRAVTAHARLLEAAAHGDDAALTSLVRLHHDRVYRFGLRVCRDPFDADDAVQEAFVKLSARPDVVAAPSALSWLMTVVRNACMRLLRPFRRERRAFGERSDAVELAGDQLSPEAALARWQLIGAVHAAIAELAEPYRAVLVLRDLEGLSGAATCEALGIGEAAMKTRLHRAREMLRERVHARIDPTEVISTSSRMA